MTFDLQPYCGKAPSPTDLLFDWNLDPILIVAIAMFAGLTWRRAHEQHVVGQWAVVMFLALVAFVSPLCALSSALFSARAFHHLVLISIAAPLSCSFLSFDGKIINRVPTIVVFALHTTMLWMWHLPIPYAWALSGSLAYWLMEIPLVFSALWLWKKILDETTPAGEAIVAAIATVFQMTALGAFLTLAEHPLFSPHFLTADLYGFSPLQDQQLAGLLMWIPASLPYLAAILYRVAMTISRSSREPIIVPEPLEDAASS